MGQDAFINIADVPSCSVAQTTVARFNKMTKLRYLAAVAGGCTFASAQAASATPTPTTTYVFFPWEIVEDIDATIVNQVH